MVVNSTDLIILQWNCSRFTPVEAGGLYLMLNEFTGFEYSGYACSTFWGVWWDLVRSIILLVFQFYIFHQPGNAARIWKLMGQVQLQMQPGMLLRPGSPPNHHSCCQHLTNLSSSVLLQEIKATFLLYYPVIFMWGGKVNVRVCHSTHFTPKSPEQLWASSLEVRASPTHSSASEDVWSH